MKSGQHLPPVAGVHECIWLTAIMALAIAVRLYDLGGLSIWLDEAVTYNVSRLSLVEMMSNLRHQDVHPPLFFILQHFALFFGDSEFVLRLLPAGAGVIGVFMVYWIGRRFVTPACGLAAAAFLATSGAHIQFSQEARPYSLLFLGLCVAVYGLLTFLEAAGSGGETDAKTDSGSQIKGATVYAIAALAVLYTHYIALFYVFGLNLVVLMAWKPSKMIQFKALHVWAGAQLTVLVLWLPGYMLFRTQAGRGLFSWLEQRTVYEAVVLTGRTVAFPWFGDSPRALEYAGLGLVASMVLAVAVHLRGRFQSTALVSMTFMIAVPVGMWLAGFHTPVLMNRTLLATLVGAALAFGMAVSTAPTRAISVALLSLMLGGNALSAHSYFTDHEKEQWREAVELLDTSTGRDDLVILCADFNRHPFAYYVRRNQSPYSVAGWNTGSKRLRDVGDLRRAGVPRSGDEWDLASTFSEVWVVKAHCDGENWDAFAVEMNGQGYSATLERQLEGIQLYRFVASSEQR